MIKSKLLQNQLLIVLKFVGLLLKNFFENKLQFLHLFLQFLKYINACINVLIQLYSRLKKERPDFWKHLVMIESDTGLSDLGLSSSDREMLVENTNIVFHCAATVRFDEKIRAAININVRGTKLMLLMAKEMKNLKVGKILRRGKEGAKWEYSKKFHSKHFLPDSIC